MSDSRRPLRIFFSWQSDLQRSLTTAPIRSALAKVKASIEASHPIDIILDEAARDTSGSPEIPRELAEKIRLADIFIGDLTTVSRPEGLKRSFPNPNVTFELGIAAAHLGWNRIIMLFNVDLASMDDLPFDIRNHRFSTFRLDKPMKSADEPPKQLLQLLEVAVLAVIQKDPKRPRDLEGKSDDQIKRSRDVENVRWFMRQINTVIMDKFIEDLPQYIHWKAVIMWEGIAGIMDRSDFKLYDKAIYAEMKGLRDSFRKILDQEAYYHETNNIELHSFGIGGHDLALTKDEDKALDVIRLNRSKLSKRFSNLMEHIHERYLEIDVDETNRLYLEDYARHVEAD